MSDPSAVLYHAGTDAQFAHPEIPLGPWSSYSLAHDAKHLSFVLARYKFVAKLLEGKARVLEVGCGDGFGLPIVAQAVGQLWVVDQDPRLIRGVEQRLCAYIRNFTAIPHDMHSQPVGFSVDAAYSIDVLEHIDPASEETFLRNIIACLPQNGVMITGTPNKDAAVYASPQSAIQHVNLKTNAGLRERMSRYFENVFMFGMNDEVVHTGFGPMSHYLWSVAVGVKGQWR